MRVSESVIGAVLNLEVVFYHVGHFHSDHVFYNTCGEFSCCFFFLSAVALKTEHYDQLWSTSRLKRYKWNLKKMFLLTSSSPCTNIFQLLTRILF